MNTSFPSTLSAKFLAEGRSGGSSCKFKTMVGYLEGIPKQFSPIGIRSTEVTGKAFREGYPGAGMMVPGTSFG